MLEAKGDSAMAALREFKGVFSGAESGVQNMAVSPHLRLWDQRIQKSASLVKKNWDLVHYTGSFDGGGIITNNKNIIVKLNAGWDECLCHFDSSMTFHELFEVLKV